MFSLFIALLVASFICFTAASPACSTPRTEVSSSCRQLQDVYWGIDAELMLASSWRNKDVGSFIEAGIALSHEDNSALKEVIEAFLVVHQQITAIKNSSSPSNAIQKALLAVYKQVKVDICSYLELTLSDEVYQFVCTDDEVGILLLQLKLLKLLSTTKRKLLVDNWRCLVPTYQNNDFLCSYWNDFAFNGTCSNGLVSPDLESATRFVVAGNSNMLCDCAYCDPSIQA